MIETMKIYPFKYLYLLLLAVLCTTGCTRPEDEWSSETMRINLGAKVGSSVLVSRAGLDYDTQQALDISLIRWDANDGDVTAGREELGAMMGKPSADGSWVRDITFDSGKAQFYKDKTSEVGFGGWYPASEDGGWVKNDGGNVITSDGTDTYMIYNLDGETDVMVSDFSRGNFENGVPALQFRHALCMYNIYAYAVDSETKDEWGNLTQVTLSNLPGQLRVDLPAKVTSTEEPAFSFLPASGTEGETFRSYSLLETGQSVDMQTGFSAATQNGLVGTRLQGAPADGILRIHAVTEKQPAGINVAIARDFMPGHAYNIYLKFSSKGIINAEVSTADWVYEKDKEYEIIQDFDLLTDLSRYGTANCYIVSSGNRGYCFDATIKGNGVNTLTRRDGTIIRLPDTDVHLDVDKVEILRSDAMMKLNFSSGTMGIIDDYQERVETPVIKLLSDKLTNGKIVFTVPGNPDNPDDYRLPYRGNVKIGVRDKAGNIIWSWHIWVTDQPQNQGYSNGYVALDRNLGAVTTDYNTFQPARSQWSGLYYQWGRKDPIFRPTVDTSVGGEYWPISVKSHTVSVAEAHRNPITYFYSPTSNNWTTDTENSDHFWGYISIRDDVKKTLYDPCPPGYRVPDNPIWENYSESMQVGKLQNGTVFAGYQFTLNDMIRIYYPGTVCLAEGTLQNNDVADATTDIRDFVYLYSATPYEPGLYGQTDSKYDGLAYHFRYNDQAIGQEYSSVMVHDPDKYHTKRSAAYPVRCVFENSAPVVTDLSAVQSANSYVVSKTGFYKFKVTTRGNGVTGLNIVQGNSSFYRTFDAGMGAGISGIDKVDLLWWQGDLSEGSSFLTFAAGSPSSEQIAEECPVTVLDNGRVEDGYAMIYVRANKNTYGNVGLAAYDANGDILWSWHIWIHPEIQVVRLGDYSVMDRNLGATYAPVNNNDFNSDNYFANLGLYYQWGRKDPYFPPLTDSNTDTSTQPWFKKTPGGWIKKSANETASKGSIQQSVQQPLSFYTSTNTYWQTTYTDSKGPVNDLWGYVGAAGVLGQSFAKTMYDPCPPGYRVMQHNVFATANICESETETSYRLKNYTHAWGIFLKDGMEAKGTVSAGGVWFPNSRTMESKGNFGHGRGHRLSTATPCYADGSPFMTRMIVWKNSNNTYTMQEMHTDNWTTDAKVVRCQME